MMGKLWSLLDVFRKGSAVTDPKLWKNRSAATIALTALLLALSKASRGFGYDLQITEADAATVAAGVVAAVGLFVTYATTDKIGIPGLAPVPPHVWPDLSRGAPAAPEPVVLRGAEPDGVNRVDQHAVDYPRDTGG